MKPKLTIGQFYLALVVVLFLGNGGVLAGSKNSQLDLPNKIIQIASDPWCPFNCFEGEDPEGFIVEVAREAFKTQGFEVEYRNLPWIRALRSIRNGEIDIIIGSGPSDPNINTNFELGMVDETVFMVLQSSPITMENPEEILNYRLGLVGEYEYDLTPEWGRLIDNHPTQVSVNTVQGEGRLVELLELDRVDIIVGNYHVFQKFLKDRNLGNKYKILRKGFKVPIGLGFTESSKGTTIYNLYSKGLSEIRESGKLKEIFEKYNFEYKVP